MKKVIAAINMTLDGFCDHTAVDPDDQIHEHYTDLLKSAGVFLYGRITYQLMEYWRPFVEHPSGNQSHDDFAQIMDRVPKIVFSRTLRETGWQSAKIADKSLKETIRELKQQPGEDIFIGSPGLIVEATNLDLVDEYQLCVHPVIAGGGLPLFKADDGRRMLRLVNTKVFDSGAVILYYEQA